MVTDFFVYGTLKTGQIREHAWPEKPLQVKNAWTHGLLYDLGDYPALTAGRELVGGQLWSFAEQHVPRVLEVLDEIEGTNQASEKNLYDRGMVEVYLEAEPKRKAHCYRYARSEDLLGRCPMPAVREWLGREYTLWPMAES